VAAVVVAMFLLHVSGVPVRAAMSGDVAIAEPATAEPLPEISAGRVSSPALRHDPSHADPGAAVQPRPADDSDLRFRLGASLARLRARRPARTRDRERMMVKAMEDAPRTGKPPKAPVPFVVQDQKAAAAEPLVEVVVEADPVLAPAAARPFTPVVKPLTQPVLERPAPVVQPALRSRPAPVAGSAPSAVSPPVERRPDARTADSEGDQVVIVEDVSSPVPVEAASRMTSPGAAPQPAVEQGGRKGGAFERALTKLGRHRTARVKEAAKRGLVLPSAGGSIETVSPSLARIQQTVNGILARTPGVAA